jgi:hypothetical protein
VKRGPRTYWLSRRGLLRLIGLTSGGMIFGSGCGNEDEASIDGVARKNQTSALARELRSQFSYLKIESNVIDAFVRDFERHRGPWSPGSHAVPHARFLASTSFFQNGADETTPLRYATYYDPYISPCYNPFAG